MTTVLLDTEKRLLSELDELGLNAMGKELKEQLIHPEIYNSMDFIERFKELLLAHRNAYEEQQFKKLVDNASLRYRHRLSSFKTDTGDGFTSDVIFRLKNLDLIKDSRTILFVGPCGTGKTALACATAIHFMEQGYSAKFYKVQHLMQDLAIKSPLSFKLLRNRLVKTKVLILDDLGVEKICDPMAGRFKDIIDERYGKGLTIITSQVCKEAIPKIFNTEAPHVVQLLKDRLIPKNVIEIVLSGESKRGASFELR